jgi:hypothetical protein
MTILRSALLALSMLAATPAFAQQPAQPARQTAIPRTPEGRPDFHGVWATDFLPLIFQRIRGARTLVVDDAEARVLSAALYAGWFGDPVGDPGDQIAIGSNLPRVNGQWRTSMIVSPEDGRVPLTAEGGRLASELAVRNNVVPAGHEQRPWMDRCLGSTGTAPFGTYPTSNIREVMQTADNVVIFSDDTGETRIIGIGAVHRPAAIVSFLGDSIARWEGDVLVVETTGIRGEQATRPVLPGLVVRTESKVIERFSLISADELLYQFTVEDPVVYSRPWQAEYSMSRHHVRTYESACHEGNYSIPNILKAAREAERRAAR